MRLEGACSCGAVQFSLESPTPVPFMHCYCSLCRKMSGGGGYAINLGGLADTLTVKGREAMRKFQAVIDGKESPLERHFCGTCHSALWTWDPRWPELIHPFASAITTPLPEAPERVHIMLRYKPGWVPVPEGQEDRHFQEYPDESLEAWHKRHGLFEG